MGFFNTFISLFVPDGWAPTGSAAPPSLGVPTVSPENAGNAANNDSAENVLAPEMPPIPSHPTVENTMELLLNHGPRTLEETVGSPEQEDVKTLVAQAEAMVLSMSLDFHPSKPTHLGILEKEAYKRLGRLFVQSCSKEILGVKRLEKPAFLVPGFSTIHRRGVRGHKYRQYHLGGLIIVQKNIAQYWAAQYVIGHCVHGFPCKVAAEWANMETKEHVCFLEGVNPNYVDFNNFTNLIL